MLDSDLQSINFDKMVFFQVPVPSTGRRIDTTMRPPGGCWPPNRTVTACASCNDVSKGFLQAVVILNSIMRCNHKELVHLD